MKQTPYKDDFYLVQDALDGNKDAWDALFLEILQPYINGAVGKAFLPAYPDLFEETVLEAVFQVYSSLPKYRGEAKITTWAYYYIMNAVSKTWQVLKRQRETDSLSESAQSADGEPFHWNSEDDLVKRLLLMKVKEVLGDMSGIYQRAIELHVFDGLSASEIATKEGVSLNTAKSWLKRARKKLKAHFQKV